MSTHRDQLPYVDIMPIGGLNTKTNPEVLKQINTQEMKNVDFIEEYGSIAKSKGNSRVLPDPLLEGGSAVPVSWIGFYKSQDYAGQIVRETLFQAGTKLFQKGATSATTPTEIATGQPSGLFRSHDQFNRFMLITGQDPYITGTLGDRYKFDGFQLGRWGVTAPGREETILDGFENASNYSSSGGFVANETAIAFRGTSMKMTKRVGSNSVFAQRAGMTPFAVNNVVEDRCELAVYIPEITFRKLRQTGTCFEITFSSNDNFTVANGDWVRYDFRVGDFQKGWNTLSMDFSVYPDPPLGDTNDAVNFDDQNMTALKLEFFFQSGYIAEAVDVYVDHLIGLDQGTPLVAAGAAGTVFTGGSGALWSYVVTYENMYGHESNQGTIFDTSALQADASAITDSVIYAYDDHTELTATGTTNLATLVGGGSGGDDCVTFGHGSGTTSAIVERQAQAFDLSIAQSSEATLDVKIAVGIRAKLATDGVRVQLGDDALSNYHQWRFNSNTIEEGDWTTLTIDLTDPDNIVGEIDLSDIENVAVTFEFADTSQTASAAELQVNNLTIQTANSYASWELSEIPVSSDPDVNKRHIYRTIANGTAHFFVGTLNDNTTTDYSDTVSDSSLGVTQPPQPGQFHDNTVPPNAGIVKVWKNTVFMAGDPKDPNVLYFSRDDLPEAFPLINGFELDAQITGMFETANALIITTDKDYWRVQGDNPDYYVDRIIRSMGCVGHRAAGETRRYGWAHDFEAARLYDLNDTNRFTEAIANKISDTSMVDRDNLKYMWSLHSKTKNLILFFYPDSSGAYPTAYAYQYFMDDLRNGNWWQFDYPSGLDFRCGEEVEDSTGIERIYVGGDDGMVYEILTGDTIGWVDADGVATNLTSEIQTRYLRAGVLASQTRGVTGRWKPRYIELRLRNNQATESNYTVTIDTADGPGNNQTVRDTGTLTMTFASGIELQREALQDLVSGEWVRVKVVNSEGSTVEPVIYGLRLYVEARPSQFTVTGSTPGGRT
jgi:hypothetical protein